MLPIFFFVTAIVATACVAGSVAVARHLPRLSILLSSALGVFIYWSGRSSYQLLTAHGGDGFALLGAFLVGSVLALLAAIALVCALILLRGVLRSSAKRFAPVILAPMLVFMALEMSAAHREQSRRSVDFLREHMQDIRYREDCVRLPQEYQETCRANRWPTPLAPIYLPNGTVDEAATRKRDYEVGASWAREHHAARTSDCLTVWSERSESTDVMHGCKDYILGH